MSALNVAGKRDTMTKDDMSAWSKKKVDPILTKKRKWVELQDAVVAAGGNVRYYVAGKRYTMTKEEMSAWLKKKKTKSWPLLDLERLFWE